MHLADAFIQSDIHCIQVTVFIYLYKLNDTLKKKLKLPAGGGKCLYESFIHSIRSKHGFIQKLNTIMLLTDTQQFCGGFIGNLFVGKI